MTPTAHADRRLRVAFIHQPWSVIDPPVDNADSVALLTDETARRLARMGCRVVCYCRLGKGQPPVAEYAGVEYRRFPVSVDRWVKLAMQTFDQYGLRDARRPFFASPLCYRQFIDRVIDDLGGEGFDVVHIHNFSQFVTRLRTRVPRVKIVLQMHCEWLNQLDEALIEERLEQTDLVLGVSEFLQRKLSDRFPRLAGRFDHLHNGVDAERFARGSDEPTVLSEKRILYVGRLSPEKGVHVLLDAFRVVLKMHPEAHLVLIGPHAVVPREMILRFCADPKVKQLGSLYGRGAYEALLKEKLAALDKKNVTVLGDGIAHSRLPQQYHAASIFAFPSIWDEPFGMPVAEAMAAGVPVVATRGGGLPELVEHGRTGLLVKRGDPLPLADAIQDLLDNPERRQAMGRLARERIEKRFTWEHVARTLLGMYQSLLSTSAARRASA